MYDRLERKYIKCTLDELNQMGYRCPLSIKELQNLIIYLSDIFNTKRIENMEEIGENLFYFKYIQTKMTDYNVEFLLAYYRVRKALITFSDCPDQKAIEVAYYPVIKNSANVNNIAKEDVSYIIFDEKSGLLKRVPVGINDTNISNIEELCIQNENNSIYDFSFIKSQIFIHKCDIIIRDIVLECACIKIMSKRGVDLDSRVKRTKLFIKCMTDNIPNFTKANYLYSMVDAMYEENKNELSSNIYSFKR